MRLFKQLHSRCKRRPPSALSIGCALFLVLAILGNEARGRERPNIVFILADDLGWSDLACYGNEFNETPNLDQMAREGMRFSDAYAAAPVCSPTRASILTGQYPPRVGVTDWIPGHWYIRRQLTVPLNRQPYLPAESITIAERLQEAGYVSGFFGKWHLGDQVPVPDSSIRETYPDKQGFDQAIISPHPYGGRNLKFFDFDSFPEQSNTKDEYLTDWLTERSLEFIEAHQDQQFFLYVSHLAVHNPLRAKAEIIEKYERKPKPDHGVNHATYAAMLESLDYGVGRILTKLQSLTLDENTLVIFYSDNGGVQGYAGGRSINTSNAPLRDQKGTLYEGGIRVPLIARWPGRIAEGSVCSTPVISTDFLPTFLELAGLEPGSEQPTDGRSLLPILQGSQEPIHEALYWHYPHYHSSSPASVIRSGDWKLIEFFEGGNTELYNLREDISESRELSHRHPDLVNSLLQSLRAWRAEIAADLPVPNPAYDPQKLLERGAHPYAP